jgi:serine/threonine-protein kinase ULK/ATG1
MEKGLEKRLLEYPPEKKVENYQWSFKAHLGTGSFGKVYLGKDTRTSALVAIKVIATNNLGDGQMMKHLQNEIQVMKSISGPNIVEFIDVFWTMNNVYIITEYCEGGDLRQLM